MILDKLIQLFTKAFADDKITVTKKIKLVVGRVQNIVGNGENAGIFSIPTMFSKDIFFNFIKS